MASEEFIYSLAYLLIAVCVVVPPTEFRSAGLTVQNLLSTWLGSEDVYFIHYHIKRTTATVVVHSLLPIGYYIGLSFVAPDLNLQTPWEANSLWQLYLLASTIYLICASALAVYWKSHKWSCHRIARTLSYHGTSWRAVAAAIDIEFRRIDKFTSGPSGARVIITDSWIMKVSAYNVNVAHQQDCHLNILKSEDHSISHESSTGAQFLTIEVISVNGNIKPFTIRLNSSEYRDLKDKVQAPVVNARNVVITQSLTDRFLDAFREQVAHNPRYHLPEGSVEPDPCIGCMQITSNVKLQKFCEDASQGECVQCYCRPMWCMECMCKWFANRQDQRQPETWMSGKSPCPTCRSKFCVLDVCRLA
ncbi:E3 ubiquitin-protein ligase TM129-like [Amphiura filiformis]|uniref:E3 ubiquitin-protein ligase TM129-like n=1 Tax=Amphiura filiformis TaxID=82378 RepID=UPI003B20F56B